jgi:hypothetical protein
MFRGIVAEPRWDIGVDEEPVTPTENRAEQPQDPVRALTSLIGSLYPAFLYLHFD